MDFLKSNDIDMFEIKTDRRLIFITIYFIKKKKKTTKKKKKRTSWSSDLTESKELSFIFHDESKDCRSVNLLRTKIFR